MRTRLAHSWVASHCAYEKAIAPVSISYASMAILVPQKDCRKGKGTMSSLAASQARATRDASPRDPIGSGQMRTPEGFDALAISRLRRADIEIEQHRRLREEIRSLSARQQADRAASSSALRFLIGRNSRGKWVARDEQGRRGGLFNAFAEAVRFALREVGRAQGTIVLVSHVVELFGPASVRANAPATATARQFASAEKR